MIKTIWLDILGTSKKGNAYKCQYKNSIFYLEISKVKIIKRYAKNKNKVYMEIPEHLYCSNKLHKFDQLGEKK